MPSLSLSQDPLLAKCHPKDKCSSLASPSSWPGGTASSEGVLCPLSMAGTSSALPIPPAPLQPGIWCGHCLTHVLWHGGAVSGAVVPVQPQGRAPLAAVATAIPGEVSRSCRAGAAGAVGVMKSLPQQCR